MNSFYLVTAMSLLLISTTNAGDTAPGRTMARQVLKTQKTWITHDHSKHKILQQDFKNGSELTDACISCHNNIDAQFRKTIHWTWLAPDPETKRIYGKGGDSFNNFCISTNKMKDQSCLDCHAGWKGIEDGINCLVCHIQEDINWKESFSDIQAFLAEKDDPESLEMAADIQQEIRDAFSHIGQPARSNCGGCHFYGGGGDGVKHGDLDTSLIKPTKTLDVHMGVDGKNFLCVRCHTTKAHHIDGRLYTVPASLNRKSLIEDDLTSKITCESCHSSTPHKSNSKANAHTDKVACQSCHIPTYARVNPTKMKWDWSKAGKKKDGKAYKTKGAFGKYDYMSIKGKMKWEKNVQPQYFWFNGSIKSLTGKDMIDVSQTVKLSHPEGSPDDGYSRIFPFKVHRSLQPYDKINKTLLAPLLSGKEGYWETLDWPSALEKGMEFSKLPFSGKFDFVETTYVFPITHMVAPKENVVSCSECHTRKNSRMDGLAGVYMPGRDTIRLIDLAGWAIIFASLAGVLLHGFGRIVAGRRKG